jgi:RNA-directed DNA polymerase
VSDYRWVRYGFSHEQTPRSAVHYVRERFKRRQRPLRVVVPADGAEPTVAQIADPDNLLRVFHELRARAGQAPGPDGVSYGLLGRREAPAVLRGLSRAVLAGEWRPTEGRKVPIPKVGGGTRTLTVRGICERVVAAALAGAMTPLLERTFLNMSWGFRPGRGPWGMLADMGRVAAGRGRWALATDDVRKAFDNVNIDDALGDYRRHVTNPALLSLIEVVLRGSEGKAVGIDQGSGFSPLSLNLRLHYAHDLASQGHDPPARRYADNLVYLCADVAEGNRALERAAQLLKKAGLALKGEDGPPKDLRRGETAQMLGFTLSGRGDRLHLGLGVHAWAKLRQGLEEAHQTEDPAGMARKVVTGWISAFGPAFEGMRRDFPRQVLQTAARIGFREIDTPGGLRGRCLAARDNWLTFRKGWARWPRGEELGDES